MTALDLPVEVPWGCSQIVSSHRDKLREVGITCIGLEVRERGQAAYADDLRPLGDEKALQLVSDARRQLRDDRLPSKSRLLTASPEKGRR